MDKKIIVINYGGLGDHLQFSTLPEAFHKQGYETYISILSSYRSKDIYDLVWAKNPYVRGMSEERPNAGHISSFRLPHDEMSMNRNWEIIFNADNQSKYPVIYYQPDNITDYNDSLVIDINAFSSINYDFSFIEQKINEIISENTFKKIYYLVPSQVNYSRIEKIINIENSIKISTKDIFEYADLIYSCKRLVCLWSGANGLSSAIKSKYNSNIEVDCFHPNTPDFGTTNRSFFWYDNVNYIKA
jgi:hypothetical protein